MNINILDLETVTTFWFSKGVLSIVPIKAGSSCHTYAVHTEDGDYVLRSFSAKCQAEQEYVVSDAIAAIGVGAEIMKTLDGNGYVQYGNVFYNLQAFLPGVQPNLGEPAQIAAAGKATAKLHKALSHCCFQFSDRDRFPTIQLLRQAEGMYLLDTLFPRDIDTLKKRIAFLTRLESKLSHDQMIHGDLGNWNMLWDGMQLRIIDFGESRKGDYHFDLAAVICCILSKCKSQSVFVRYLTLFINAYKSCGGYVDFEKLHIAIYLWLLRGVLASTVMIHDPIEREKACHRFTQELIRYKSYIGEILDET